MRGPLRGIVSYAWAAPNSLLGVIVGSPAFLRGHVALVDGALELSGPGIDWLLRRAIPLEGGASAITLGHVVVARDERSMQRCRVHERAHVRQYERWGPLFLPAYFAAGAVVFLRGKHPYTDNPFEIEARRAESAASCRTAAVERQILDEGNRRAGQ